MVTVVCIHVRGDLKGYLTYMFTCVIRVRMARFSHIGSALNAYKKQRDYE